MNALFRLDGQFCTRFGYSKVEAPSSFGQRTVSGSVAGAPGIGYGRSVIPGTRPLALPSPNQRVAGVTRRSTAASAWLLLAMTLSSCQSFKGVSQCNRVLGMVNTSLEQAKELHEKPANPENYKALSELFGRLEADLIEQAKAEGELERNAKSYAKQMRRLSRETRNYAQALERLDKARVAADAEQEKQARDELGRIRERAGRLSESSTNEAKKLREACRPKG